MFKVGDFVSIGLAENNDLLDHRDNTPMDGSPKFVGIIGRFDSFNRVQLLMPKITYPRRLWTEGGYCYPKCVAQQYLFWCTNVKWLELVEKEYEI